MDDAFQDYMARHPFRGSTPMDKLRHFEEDEHDQTEFFRHPESLKVLSELVLPRYDGLIRIASVGASTGEEPYSILFAAWAHRDRLLIHAYDVHSERLEAAQRGAYCIQSDDSLVAMLRQMPPTNESVYTLTRMGKHHAHVILSDDVRRRVRFSAHDLFKSSLPKGYDVVFLQNLLMHYAEPQRAQMLAYVFASLSEGGWLILEPEPSFAEEFEWYYLWAGNLQKYGFERVEQFPETFTHEQVRHSHVFRKKRESSDSS